MKYTVDQSTRSAVVHCTRHQRTRVIRLLDSMLADWSNGERGTVRFPLEYLQILLRVVK